MIPVFDVGSSPPFDRTNNGSAPEGWWEVGNSPDPSNDEYGDWSQVSGPELDHTLEWERAELLALDSASMTPQQFETAAKRLEEDNQEDDWYGTPMSSRLDVGIVSCVAALNFLGIPTTASCRGHFGSDLGRDVPHVRFVGDDIPEETWHLLHTIAEKTGCQLVGCGAGLVEIIGHSCMEMLEFAHAVRRARPA